MLNARPETATENRIATTAGGSNERGTAIQRHFARAAEQIDGVKIVVSFSNDTVCLSVTKTEAFEPLCEVADDHDFELQVNGSFESGHADIEAVLKEVRD